MLSGAPIRLLKTCYRIRSKACYRTTYCRRATCTTFPYSQTFNSFFIIQHIKVKLLPCGRSLTVQKTELNFILKLPVGKKPVLKIEYSIIVFQELEILETTAKSVDDIIYQGDQNLCPDKTTCTVITDCRLLLDLMDKTCLLPKRLKDLTWGYYKTEPMVCCPNGGSFSPNYDSGIKKAEKKREGN